MEFFRLIPTYTDRRSFYLSVLDLDMSFKNESLVSKAREFFVSTLLKTDIEQTLVSITDQVLSNLMYLFFEVHNDGTGITDTALYEGLDTRNRCVMMMCTVTSTGVSLSPFDRVRTHLLDFFKTFDEK